MKMIAATGNQGKVREMQSIFSKLGITVISQREADICVEAEETGNTFEENAIIKAKAVAMICDDFVIADDSGLCVDALDGAPGIYSARYAGEDANDNDRIQKILSQMNGVQNRKAKFVSCIAVICPDGRIFTTTGETTGKILEAPEGENGFGYDPIFYSDDLQKSFALASAEEKNSVSHRGRALEQMYHLLQEKLEWN